MRGENLKARMQCTANNLFKIGSISQLKMEKKINGSKFSPTLSAKLEPTDKQLSSSSWRDSRRNMKCMGQDESFCFWLWISVRSLRNLNQNGVCSLDVAYMQLAPTLTYRSLYIAKHFVYPARKGNFTTVHINLQLTVMKWLISQRDILFIAHAGLKIRNSSTDGVLFLLVCFSPRILFSALSSTLALVNLMISYIIIMRASIDAGACSKTDSVSLSTFQMALNEDNTPISPNFHVGCYLLPVSERVPSSFTGFPSQQMVKIVGSLLNHLSVFWADTFILRKLAKVHRHLFRTYSRHGLRNSGVYTEIKVLLRTPNSLSVSRTPLTSIPQQQNNSNKSQQRMEKRNHSLHKRRSSKTQPCCTHAKSFADVLEVKRTRSTTPYGKSSLAYHSQSVDASFTTPPIVFMDIEIPDQGGLNGKCRNIGDNTRHHGLLNLRRRTMPRWFDSNSFEAHVLSHVYLNSPIRYKRRWGTKRTSDSIRSITRSYKYRRAKSVSQVVSSQNHLTRAPLCGSDFVLSSENSQEARNLMKGNMHPSSQECLGKFKLLDGTSTKRSGRYQSSHSLRRGSSEKCYSEIGKVRVLRPSYANSQHQTSLEPVQDGEKTEQGKCSMTISRVPSFDSPVTLDHTRIDPIRCAKLKTSKGFVLNISRNRGYNAPPVGTFNGEYGDTLVESSEASHPYGSPQSASDPGHYRRKGTMRRRRRPSGHRQDGFRTTSVHSEIDSVPSAGMTLGSRSQITAPTSDIRPPSSQAKLPNVLNKDGLRPSLRKKRNTNAPGSGNPQIKNVGDGEKESGSFQPSQNKYKRSSKSYDPCEFLNKRSRPQSEMDYRIRQNRAKSNIRVASGPGRQGSISPHLHLPNEVSNGVISPSSFLARPNRTRDLGQSAKLGTTVKREISSKTIPRLNEPNSEDSKITTDYSSYHDPGKCGDSNAMEKSLPIAPLGFESAINGANKQLSPVLFTSAEPSSLSVDSVNEMTLMTSSDTLRGSQQTNGEEILTTNGKNPENLGFTSARFNLKNARYRELKGFPVAFPYSAKTKNPAIDKRAIKYGERDVFESHPPKGENSSYPLEIAESRQNVKDDSQPTGGELDHPLAEYLESVKSGGSSLPPTRKVVQKITKPTCEVESKLSKTPVEGLANLQNTLEPQRESRSGTAIKLLLTSSSDNSDNSQDCLTSKILPSVDRSISSVTNAQCRVQSRSRKKNANKRPESAVAMTDLSPVYNFVQADKHKHYGRYHAKGSHLTRRACSSSRFRTVPSRFGYSPKDRMIIERVTRDSGHRSQLYRTEGLYPTFCPGNQMTYQSELLNTSVSNDSKYDSVPSHSELPNQATENDGTTSGNPNIPKDSSGLHASASGTMPPSAAPHQPQEWTYSSPPFTCFSPLNTGIGVWISQGMPQVFVSARTVTPALDGGGEWVNQAMTNMPSLPPSGVQSPTGEPSGQPIPCGNSYVECMIRFTQGSPFPNSPPLSPSLYLHQSPSPIQSPTPMNYMQYSQAQTAVPPMSDVTSGLTFSAGQISYVQPASNGSDGPPSQMTSFYSWVRFGTSNLDLGQSSSVEGRLNALLARPYETLSPEEQRTLEDLLNNYQPNVASLAKAGLTARTPLLERKLEALLEKPFSSLTQEEKDLLVYLSGLSSMTPGKSGKPTRTKAMEDKLKELLRRPYEDLSQDERELLAFLLNNTETTEAAGKPRTLSMEEKLKELRSKPFEQLTAKEREMLIQLASLPPAPAASGGKKIRTPSMEAKLAELRAKPYEQLTSDERQLLTKLSSMLPWPATGTGKRVRSKSMDAQLRSLLSQPYDKLTQDQKETLAYLLNETEPPQTGGRARTPSMEAMLSMLREKPFEQLTDEERQLLVQLSSLPPAPPADGGKRIRTKSMQAQLQELLEKPYEELTQDQKETLAYLLKETEPPQTGGKVRTPSMEAMLTMLRDKPFEQLTEEERALLVQLSSLPPAPSVIRGRRVRTKSMESQLQELLSQPFENLSRDQRNRLAYLLNETEPAQGSGRARTPSMEAMLTILREKPFEQLTEEERKLLSQLSSLPPALPIEEMKKVRTPSMELKLRELLSVPYASLNPEEREALAYLLNDTEPAQYGGKARTPSMEATLKALREKPFEALTQEERELLAKLSSLPPAGPGWAASRERSYSMEAKLKELLLQPYDALSPEDKETLAYLLNNTKPGPQGLMLLRSPSMEAKLTELRNKPFESLSREEKNLLRYLTNLPPIQTKQIRTPSMNEKLNALLARPYESLSPEEKEVLNDLLTNTQPAQNLVAMAQQSMLGRTTRTKFMELQLKSLLAVPYDMLDDEQKELLAFLQSLPQCPEMEMEGKVRSPSMEIKFQWLLSQPRDMLSPADQLLLDELKKFLGADSSFPMLIRLRRTPSMEAKLAWLKAQPSDELTDEQKKELIYLLTLSPPEGSDDQLFQIQSRGYRTLSMENMLAILLAKPFEHLTPEERKLLLDISRLLPYTQRPCDMIDKETSRGGMWPWNGRPPPTNLTGKYKDMLNAPEKDENVWKCPIDYDKFPPFIPYPSQAVYFRDVIGNQSPQIDFWPWTMSSVRDSLGPDLDLILTPLFSALTHSQTQSQPYGQNSDSHWSLDVPTFKGRSNEKILDNQKELGPTKAAQSDSDIDSQRDRNRVENPGGSNNLAVPGKTGMTTPKIIHSSSSEFDHGQNAANAERDNNQAFVECYESSDRPSELEAEANKNTFGRKFFRQTGGHYFKNLKKKLRRSFSANTLSFSKRSHHNLEERPMSSSQFPVSPTLSGSSDARSYSSVTADSDFADDFTCVTHYALPSY